MIVVIGMGGELAEASDDKRQLVRDAVLLGQDFNSLDGCCCERNSMNSGACDGACWN